MQGLGRARDLAAGSDGAEGRATCPRRARRGHRRLRAVRSPTPGRTWRRWLRLRGRVEGDQVVLNGEKTWISNGGIADFYVVFARTGRGPRRGASFRPSSSTPARGLRDRRRAHRGDRAAPRWRGCAHRLPRSRRAARRRGGRGLQGRDAHARRVPHPSVAAAALWLRAARALDEALARATTRQDVRPAARRLPARRPSWRRWRPPSTAPRC